MYGRITAFFFFNDTPTTEIYTLSLHDALPIYRAQPPCALRRPGDRRRAARHDGAARQPRGADAGGAADVHLTGDDRPAPQRSEEHTSELQSQSNLVCRLLLEKKKIIIKTDIVT